MTMTTASSAPGKILTPKLTTTHSHIRTQYPPASAHTHAPGLENLGAHMRPNVLALSLSPSPQSSSSRTPSNRSYVLETSHKLTQTYTHLKEHILPARSSFPSENRRLRTLLCCNNFLNLASLSYFRRLCTEPVPLGTHTSPSRFPICT